MFGHQVSHKFGDMSYLITKSCFFDEVESMESDTNLDEFRKLSVYEAESMIDNEESTRVYSECIDYSS